MIDAVQDSAHPHIHPTAQVIDSHLGDWTEVAADCVIEASALGAYSYVMQGSDIHDACLGRFCSVAARVRINPGNHPLWRVALHHFSYRSEKYGFGADDDTFFAWRHEHAVRLGHDVWVGHAATVLPGVSVGTGAAIGAGAVVTRDVEPFAVVAGNPARVLRKRFPDDVIEDLLEIAWWEWPHTRISEALSDFRDLEARDFVARYREVVENIELLPVDTQASTVSA